MGGGKRSFYFDDRGNVLEIARRHLGGLKPRSERELELEMGPRHHRVDPSSSLSSWILSSTRWDSAGR